MIPLKTIHHSFTKPTNDLVSALAWKIHKTHKTILLTNSISVDTSKPLIGFIDTDAFIVARSRPIYKMLLPVVTIQGKFTTNNGKTDLKLQYKPSIFTTIILGFIVWGAIGLLMEAFRIELDLEAIISLLLWFILYPVGGFVLTMREGNITKDMILEFLNAAEQ